jgi:hypothetical protein
MCGHGLPGSTQTLKRIRSTICTAARIRAVLEPGFRVYGGWMNAASEEPIACALDNLAFENRMDEFGALFRDALTGSERTAAGIRFRFANRGDVEARVRDLAARELECCSFFRFSIATHGEEVWWDATVDNPEAQPILDELLALPERLAGRSAKESHQ